MRVALFTNNYLPFRGGVTTAVETLRRGLERLRHRAWVFAPASRPAVPDPPWVFRYPSIPAPTYPGFALALPFSARLYRTARALDPDIVHAQHPFLLGPTARRFARRRGRPLVFTYHTRYEKYAHYVPLPERPVAAVPTGVPLDLFHTGGRHEARRRLGLTDDELLCLYVGRLDREKSVERI